MTIAVPNPRLAFICPGHVAFDWLASIVRDLKGDDPFRPVTVIVPNQYAGLMARWWLARRCGYANVRMCRLAHLPPRFAPPGPRGAITPVAEASAIRQALRTRPGMFANVEHRSLHRALAEQFHELRRAEIDPASLAGRTPPLPLPDAGRGNARTRIAHPPRQCREGEPRERRDMARPPSPRRGGVGVGSFRSVARALFDLYAEFSRIVADYDTPTSRADVATRSLLAASEPPAPLAELGAVVLFLPARLDPAEARFLAALARWTPLVAAFPAFDDPLGDRPGQNAARLLSEAVVGRRKEGTMEGMARAARGRGRPRCLPWGGVGTPRHEEGTSDRVAFSLGAAPPLPRADTGVCPYPEPPTLSPARVSIIRVPEPAEEVREIVRSIARDLAEGIPLYRIAVVYRHGDPYAPLVRDALDQAGFPWVSSEGTRLSETRPGRALLDLLALPERGFTREAVLAWLDTSPRIEGEVGTISVAAWNRLSRRAGVLRGAAEWQARLRRHAEEIEVELARPAEDDRATLSSARTRWVRESRLIADFVAELSAALRHPPPGATWTDLVARTIQRRDRFVGATERWSESRRAEAEAVDRAIRALAAGDEVAEPPSFGNFQEALVAALENERVPTGQPGEGVMVEPLVAVMGLAFARVYLLGLSEGAYPPSPAADPFFPDDGADPLQRRARQREEERRDFLAALAALDGADARVILSVPESDGRRAAFPSRWLLEIASRLAGRSLDAGAFANLGEQPWLRIVRSARDGVERALEPADLEDRRLADLIHWRQRGRSAAEHPLARRPDLPLGNALRLARARASNRLTPYDGNLSARSSSRRLIESFARGRPSSASAVETWATCGFRFFLAYVLRVEPTDRPEDRWRIDGRERGQLVHRILDQFFRVMRVNGRPAPGEGYTRADQEELEKIAAQRFAEVERRGAAGYALAWETERRAILSDLRLFLRFDAEERVRSGLLPTYFEQRFGFDRRDSWPELAIAVADGTRDVVFRFQGVVDRVDLDPSGKTARAYDYKTGRADAYAGIQDDPVLAGQHLQLALYRRVIQENLKADVVGASYWFVTSKETFALETVEAGAAADARLDAVLGVVARGLRQGAFPSIPGDPSRESFANCVFCDFDRICPVRRDQVWKRKSEDPIARIHRGLARNSADDG